VCGRREGTLALDRVLRLQRRHVVARLLRILPVVLRVRHAEAPRPRRARWILASEVKATAGCDRRLYRLVIDSRGFVGAGVSRKVRRVVGGVKAVARVRAAFGVYGERLCLSGR
jgi:hypothetical protein